MIVCVCKAVSDRQVRSATAKGAVSLRDLQRELGVGACCGRCLPVARRLLEEAPAIQAEAHANQMPGQMAGLAF